MIVLRNAEYIRQAELFGYPAGDSDGEPYCGESPTLPEWLWQGEDECDEPRTRRETLFYQRRTTWDDTL